jgi:hypothetical protein
MKECPPFPGNLASFNKLLCLSAGNVRLGVLLVVEGGAGV